MREYALIKAHYGDKTAKRSGVPLINHIDEGLLILDYLDATDATKRAFCLHPLMQADEDLAVFIESDYGHIDRLVLLLAMEYRNQANAWLSDKVSKDGDQRIVCQGRPGTGPLTEVRDMLIADKVQNYKDFLKYHDDTHARSDELHAYFGRWLSVLNVNFLDFRPILPD